MATAARQTPEPLLSLRNLSVGYRMRNGVQTAVDDISLDVARGEVLALVGESGSGKTTTGHAILGLLPGNGEVLGGEILHEGRDLTTLRSA